MPRPHLCPFILLALGLVTGPAVALDWPVQQLTVKAVPLQSTAETVFAFTNRSDKPVAILGVDTSCDCLDATPSAPTIAPGTSGHIRARFTVGDRHGVYERTITVTTDEGKDPVILRVQLDVPEVASLSPRSVDWKLNSPATEQVIEIRIAAGLELTITSVLPTSGLFNSRLETVAAGRHYRLYLAPQNTREATNAAFRLYAKASTGQDIILSAYGNVR